jgi:hypothetical protein
LAEVDRHRLAVGDRSAGKEERGGEEEDRGECGAAFHV